MKHLFSLLILIAITSCTKKEAATPLEEVGPGVPSVGSNIKGSDYPASVPLKPGEFSFQLLKMQSGQPKNFAHSPLSLKMALDLVYPVAGENARLAMEKGLGFQPKDQDRFRSERELASRVNRKGGKNTRLLIGNSIWLKNPKSLNQEYQSFLKSASAQVSGLDLKEMNDWVKTKTEGKIPSLFDSLDPKIPFVAVNTLYFKGEWISPFVKSNTSLGPFRSSEHSSQSVNLMRQVHAFRFYEDEFSRWVELPYQDSPFALILVLPEKDFDLKTVESKLDSSTVSDTLTKMKEESVELVVPRFKASEKSYLKNDLSLAGYSKLFAPGEWKAIWPDPDFRLGDIVQAISLEADEQGTTAAAATALTLETTSINIGSNKLFICDQPFLYFLLNRESNEIYFMGRVYQPE